ncbi:MAG: PIN domain-containing protein [Ignavibacteriae bacterium]|nr:PIN domain-containing protein [Ignavibacteriota bacterium]
MRLFLDTSVISAYCDDRKPWRRDVTRRWFLDDSSKYELFISGLVLDEIRRTPDTPKMESMLSLIDKCKIQELAITEEIKKLAALYRETLLFKELNDTIHLATVSCYGLDALVSWNFRHLVNLETIAKIHELNVANRYRIIEIVTVEQLGGGAEYGRI